MDHISPHGEVYWVLKIPVGFNADPDKVTETTNIAPAPVKLDP